jgi:hypothetical protein
MAIELTTASDSVIDSIRASLSAIGSNTLKEIIDITRANYNALTKDPNTLYVVNEGVGANSSLYKGTTKIIAEFSGSIAGNLSATGNITADGVVYAAGGNSNTWNNTSNIISINSPTWNTNSTTVTTNSGYWNDSTTLVKANSARWDSNLTTVATNSANWILDGGNTKGSDLFIGTLDNNDLFFKTNNISRLSVLNNGNIGISRISPDSKLEIFDNTLANSGNLEGSGIYLAQAWNTTGSPVALKLNITNTSSGSASKLIDLRVSESSKFNVNAQGNVGIGTSLPTSKLDIYDTTTAQGLSGAALNIYHNWNSGSVDATAIKLNVFSSGSGQNSKFLDLQLNGTSYFNVSKFGNASVIGTLSAARIVSRDLSVGASTIDWSTSNSFYKTIGSDTTFAFTNTLPGQTITVVVNSTNTWSITWPASIVWESGFYPTQAKSTETDIFTFKNVNGVIRGSLVKTPIERRVGTYAELSAAVLLGGTINVTEMITINNTINLTVSGTKLIGANNGGIILPYPSGNPTIIDVRTSNCEIRNLNLTANQPLNLNSDAGYVAIRLSQPTVTTAIDNIIIEDNNIYNVGSGIYATFSNAVNRPYNSNIRIQYNNIHAWAYLGIYLTGNIDNLLINKNTVASRDPGQIHNCGFNNIYVGQNCNYAHIINNEVSGVGAVGIEFTNNDTGSPSALIHALSGGRSNKVAFNNVYAPTAVSTKTGIRTKGTGSVHVVNNTVIGPFFAGIEIVNGPVNRAPTLVQGNHIEGMSGNQSQFISLNNTRSCNVVGNTLTTNVCAANPNQSSWGINIKNSGEDITIKTNQLTNVGTAGVNISGMRRNIEQIIPGSPTRIKILSPGFGDDVYNGKAVFISGLSGLGGTYTPSAEWQTLSGYHNITLVDATGDPGGDTSEKRYFTIPVNSTGFNTATIPVSAHTNWIDANMITLKYSKIAICSNKFVNTYKQNSGQNASFDYNILFTAVQNAVIRNNEFWVASNISLHRTISLLGGGTFYLGSMSTPVTLFLKASAGTFDQTTGDNIRIDYIEGVSDVNL